MNKLWLPYVGIHFIVFLYLWCKKYACARWYNKVITYLLIIIIIIVIYNG